MRRRAGIALLAAGVLLLAFAAATYARAGIARAEARAAWAAVEARAAVLATHARLGTERTAPLVSGAPIGRLLIPAIGLDEVIVEGVSDASLNAGPGHLPGSVLPGDAGNSVLSAHRDRHFRALGDVALGDTLETVTVSGTMRWIVVGRRVVGRGLPALFHTETPTLTLTTCWPVRYFGTAPDRLVIQAVPLTLPPAETPAA